MTGQTHQGLLAGFTQNRGLTGLNGNAVEQKASHRLDDPAFTEEKVSNYVDYGNGLFSCDISFVKHMYLIYEYMHVTDVTNSTFYFMYLQDSNEEDGRWVIVDIQEIIGE